MFANGQCTLVERLRRSILSLDAMEHRQIVERAGHRGVMGAEDRFLDFQRALVERLRQRILTLVAIEHRQIVERARDTGTVWTELSDTAYEQRFCNSHGFVVLPHGAEPFDFRP